MFFCPCCGNLLLTELASEGLRFFCQTCPYVCDIEKTITKKIALERKKVDDVLGGTEEWKNFPVMTISCENPKCKGNSANFMQLQIRSADEPATTFFNCTTCGFGWNDQTD
eukprot:TRINITY_DN6872_c0_g1_i1.p1 TRINITY_DN6872_c0_g1~~TRINITY_DN6872_c0_g1_i1.p1  ORF type:complete len:111 (+),score=28.37 TRINITY_DN6872_c0_g1_i1:57-389(+)